MPIYIVQSNDTLDKIAYDYSISPGEIAYVNQIPPPYALAIGEALLIPSMPSNDRPVIYTGGYAYPFISSYVLNETLPYLTYLYDFSYGFTSNGELVPPQADDQRLLQLTKASAAQPVITLAPFGLDGRFNNNLITAITNDYAAREQLKDNIIDIMEEKGFQGLDIDFEYILSTDRDSFTEFVSYMKASLNPLGYALSVALAPKTSATQQGLLYEGKDYEALGAIADYVLLMTYEWGYKYGPPLAVAPIPNVRAVLDYAVSAIPSEKIMLGIPNYGYDWPLPFVQGTTAATTIGNVEAIQIAINNNAIIQYDSVSQAPYFYYEKEGITHVVWFEDVRSYNAKFNLVEEYKLRGMTIWQIMRLYRAGYILLNERFAHYTNPPG